MKTDNTFYTYAYLDKSIKGKFQYSSNLTFDKLPRYIGKGTGQRAYNIENHKNHNLGLSFLDTEHIEVVLLDEDITEQDAFDKEIEYIALIGRLDLGFGPLFNKKNGGGRVSLGKPLCSLTCSLPKELIRQLHIVAENGGHTRSYIVKLALTELFKDKSRWG